MFAQVANDPWKVAFLHPVPGIGGPEALGEEVTVRLLRQRQPPLPRRVVFGHGCARAHGGKAIPWPWRLEVPNLVAKPERSHWEGE